MATADGSRVSRITQIPGNDHWPPAWSPDGTHLAFTSDGCKDNSEILITEASETGRSWNATHHPARDLFPLLAPIRVARQRTPSRVHRRATGGSHARLRCRPTR